MLHLDQLVEELERSYTEAQERHVRPCGLQRPPRGGGGRPPPEGARGPVQARAGSGGRRTPTSRRRAATPSSRRWSPDYEAEVARLEEELKLSLVERDPADEKDVIVEIRQGVGGDEAALWAGDLARMLERYAERRGFKWEELEVSPSEGGGHQGGHLRDQGRRRLLGLQVRGRHPPRPARPRDRVAGAHPHLDRDGRRDARGRGRRRRDRREGPEDRRLPLVGPRRPVGEHDRLGGADHAPARPGSSSRCRTSARSSRTATRRCACCARASTRPSASGSRPSRRPRARRRSAPASAPRRSAPTTSRRTASPTTASASARRLEDVLAGDLDEFTEALTADEQRRALEASDARRGARGLRPSTSRARASTRRGSTRSCCSRTRSA